MNNYQHKLSFRLIVFLLSFYLLLFLPAALLHAEEYDGTDGPYRVKTNTEVVLKDPARDREIPVKIYYPDNKGPFPVILYSHALGGWREGKKYLGKFWASHGYVEIFMTHYGSDRSLIDRSKSLQEIMSALRQAAKSPKAQTDRPRDVSAVIDSLDLIEKLVPELKGKMDKSNIGVSGHSFGAFTVMASAGGFAKIAREKYNTSLMDERPRAFLAMSPQAVRQGLDPTTVFSEIKRPVMTMTGSNDTDPIRKTLTGKDRMQPFENMPPGDKYNLWIEGAFHWTFGDGRRNKIPDPEHHRYIKMASLAFWDAYLKGSGKAKMFLKSKSMRKISEGQARLDFR